MKKKLLRYSLLMLMMLVGGVSSAWADDPTVALLDFTSSTEISAMGFDLPDAGAGVDITEAFTYKNITITPHKGTSDVRIWNSSGAYTLRYYKADSNGNKGGIGISVPTGNTITQIAIKGNTKLAETVADAGTITMSSDNKTLTWTPAATATEAVTTVTFLSNSTNTTNVENITVTYEAVGGSTPEPTVDYYVVGSMTDWTILSTFKMEVNPDNAAEYMLTKEFAAGAELKVKDSNGAWYPDNGGNYVLTKDGTHTIYFRPDGQGGDGWHYGYIYVDDSQATDPEPQPTVAKYYLTGSFCEWAAEDAYEMTLDQATGKYTITTDLTQGDEIKVMKVDGRASTYYPDGMGNGYIVQVTGSHTIVFNPQATGSTPADYFTVSDDEATPEPPVGGPKYYITGTFSNPQWGADESYEMTADATSGNIYTITTTLEAGAGLKVLEVVGNTLTYYPGGEGNEYIVNKTGTHTVTFDSTAGTFTVSDDEAEPQPGLADGYYLVGDFNEWTATADDILTENTAAAGEYQITKTLTAGQGIKVIKMEGDQLQTWYPADAGDYIVKVTGSHAIYFRPDGQGNNDWYYGFFFVADDVPTAGTYELTSVSDNGTVKFFVGDEMVTSANENDAVTFTIEPNEGYVADEDVLVEAYVKFEDAQAPEGLRLSIIRVLEYTEADGVYSFTMPAANARVTVTYSVDKSELAELVEDAEELLDELPSDSEAAENLQDAIDDANNVLNDPNATAEDVAEAIQTLQDAIDAAEEAIAGSTIEVNVPAEGFVTMFLEDNSKLMPTRDAGVKLYTVESVNVANEEAVLSSELTIVKGKTPFLLYNETSADITAKLVMTSGTPDAVTPAEQFQGTLTQKTFTAEDLANYDHYVLTGKNFYWAAEPGTIPANRCWIQLAKDAGAPAQLAIVFEGGTTGINNVERGALNVEGCYTLDGRRVANPTSGLYIINGKKVILK